MALRNEAFTRNTEVVNIRLWLSLVKIWIGRRGHGVTSLEAEFSILDAPFKGRRHPALELYRGAQTLHGVLLKGTVMGSRGIVMGRKFHTNMLFPLVLLAIAPAPVVADSTQENERSAVCVQVNIDTGECEQWRPYNEIPANGRLPQRNPSYENDYRLPPPEARVPAHPAATVGSGLMPSPNYAPGIGTSHKPVYEIK